MAGTTTPRTSPRSNKCCGGSCCGSVTSWPCWLVAWLVLDIPIILWDSLFVILRPMSLPGGSLAKFWTFTPTFGYNMYIQVDKMYGDMENPWALTQSIANLVEMVVQIYALVLIFGRSRRAALWVFTVNLLTLFKTVIYLVLEYLWREKVWSKDLTLMIKFFVIPNVFWIVIPTLCLLVSACKIKSALKAVPSPTTPASPKKTN